MLGPGLFSAVARSATPLRQFETRYQSRRKDPPYPSPRSGGPHACSGASCCVREPFWAHQNAKNLLVTGALPRTPLGELQRSPKPPSWWGGAPTEWALLPLPKNPTYNIVIMLACVYVHMCIKMRCYFLLNVKHGASQLYWGGGSNYLAPALIDRVNLSIFADFQ